MTQDKSPSMTRTLAFFRSDLFLSLFGGFALGIAGIALVRPASAETQGHESKAVVIEAPLVAIAP
jgi:hypothetical protein